MQRVGGIWKLGDGDRAAFIKKDFRLQRDPGYRVPLHDRDHQRAYADEHRHICDKGVNHDQCRRAPTAGGGALPRRRRVRMAATGRKPQGGSDNRQGQMQAHHRIAHARYGHQQHPVAHHAHPEGERAGNARAE